MLTLHQNAVKITEKQLEKLNLSEWIIEEKFKGIRVWLIKEHGHYRLVTRGLEDVTWNFPHITEGDWLPTFQSVQLDCELYDPSQQDEVVSGWAMTMSIDPDITANCVLKVFDILHLEDQALENTEQWFRKALLDALKLEGPLQKVPYYNAESHRQYYDHILSKGGEGIMYKNRNATYAEGRRQVSRWFKRKRRDSYDVVITGFTAGKGKFEGLIGAVEVSQMVGGKLRHICNISGMTDYTRNDITQNPGNYLNKVLTVWAMEQDSNSLALIEPSWSHIRVDKRIEDCIPNVL